ncbi:MAG: helix-turn-helix transcriptional regulator, partial [Acidimicrobiales bacterium]
DAAPLAAATRRALRESGVENVPRGPNRATRHNPAGLTARQLDVLALLADGRTNAEIAEELFVSVRTVDTHVGAILQKLGAETRRDAARRARELGVV